MPQRNLGDQRRILESLCVRQTSVEKHALTLPEPAVGCMACPNRVLRPSELASDAKAAFAEADEGCEPVKRGSLKISPPLAMGTEVGTATSPLQRWSLAWH